MISLATETERTLFFDFLPLSLGEIRGFKTRFHLYTVPGQVFYDATRKLILKGVDGVVFVADSQIERMEANIESVENLRTNLAEQGYSLDKLPYVIQYNKRDLPNAAPLDELETAQPQARAGLRGRGPDGRGRLRHAEGRRQARPHRAEEGQRLKRGHDTYSVAVRSWLGVKYGVPFPSFSPFSSTAGCDAVPWCRSRGGAGKGSGHARPRRSGGDGLLGGFHLQVVHRGADPQAPGSGQAEALRRHPRQRHHARRAAHAHVGAAHATYVAEGISDRDEAVRRILAQPRGPKGKFAYTNDGYALLAIAAEKAGGAPFFELLQREVLGRAGLRHTGFWPRCFRGARVARLSRPPRGARARENWGFKGSDGICSTAADLAAFMRAVAAGRVTAHPELLFERKVALSEDFAGRGFFISKNGTVWTRGTEDYGHNGVVKLLRDGTILVALSDVPALRREDVAQSRAMGDMLEERYLERRTAPAGATKPPP